jgi:dsRNA-specific ribonuclease
LKDEDVFIEVKLYHFQKIQNQESTRKNILHIPLRYTEMINIPYQLINTIHSLNKDLNEYDYEEKLQNNQKDFEKMLGIKIKHPKLFSQAFTTPENEFNYQRFEFLGDNVLKYYIVHYLYHKYPDYEEGVLSTLKGKMTGNIFLMKLSKKKELNKYIITTLDEISDNVFSDVFESILGVLYLQDLEDDTNVSITYLKWMGIIDKDFDFSKSIEYKKYENSNKEEIKIEKLDYEFKNKNLLNEIFIHPINQRLEFLGDSIIDIIVTLELYHKYPNESEGELTLRRQKIVQNQNLSEVSIKIYDLNKYHKIDDKMIQKDINDFIEKKGDPPKIISDIFEALVGGK